MHPGPFSSQLLDDVERRFRADGTIEPAIWDVVVATNALGLPTRASCEGHGLDDAPYVAFALDYGEHSPDDPAVASIRSGNLETRRRLLGLLDEFYVGRDASVHVQIFFAPGESEEEARQLRARFAKQRRQLERTDPDRIATNFNYRQFEGTFALRAGRPGRWSWLWTPWRYRLLARRQAEMRAFGLFLRARAERVEATCGSRTDSPSSGSVRASAP